MSIKCQEKHLISLIFFYIHECNTRLQKILFYVTSSILAHSFSELKLKFLLIISFQSFHYTIVPRNKITARARME